MHEGQSRKMPITERLAAGILPDSRPAGLSKKLNWRVFAFLCGVR